MANLKTVAHHDTKCFSFVVAGFINTWHLPGVLLIHCMKDVHQGVNKTNCCLVYSIAGRGPKKDEGEKKEDVLNIFSVASGHLYERFLRYEFLISQSLSLVTLQALKVIFFSALILLSSPSPSHLYFRIMMLSLLRHTKTPVKFWFLKNYLSPSFKVPLRPTFCL